MPMYELNTLNYIMFNEIMEREEKELANSSVTENSDRDDVNTNGTTSPKVPSFTDQDLEELMEEEGLI